MFVISGMLNSVAAIYATIIGCGLATLSLHAWVVIKKYQNHLPLYRFEQFGGRHGVAISKSTLAEWVSQTALGCHSPLATADAEIALKAVHSHAPSTTV